MLEQFKIILVLHLLMMHSVHISIQIQPAASGRESLTSKPLTYSLILTNNNTFIHDSIYSSLTGGSGQQCCYDGNGLLVTGPPGDGTVDRVSPDISTVRHFIRDVLPFLICCKAGIFSNCDEYYQRRPSDRGVDFSPPPSPRKMQCAFHVEMYSPLCYYNLFCYILFPLFVAIMWGYPHILTHGGH